MSIVPGVTRVDAAPSRGLAWLVSLTAYWFGLSILWGAISTIVLPQLVSATVPDAVKTTALAAVAGGQAIVAIIVQPLAGSASDRIGTRWGRRRPWMLVAVTIQVLLVASLAAAGSYWVILVTMLAVEVFSNSAQGPYQGLLPDMVPVDQRGLASGLFGCALMLGSIVGAAIAGVLVANGDTGVAVLFAAAAVWLGMLWTVVVVREPPVANETRPAAPGGLVRGWLRPVRQIVLRTWDRDVLDQHDYLWLLASRLFILMAAGTLQPFIFYYLQDTLGLGSQAGLAVAPISAVVAVVAVLAAIPAGALTGRFGRVRIVRASGLVGVVGCVLFAVAPAFEVLFVCGIVFGVALGAFLSADWALLTDVVPPGEAGRYLGLSNTVTAGATLLAVVVAGPIADLFNTYGSGLGYRVVFVLAALEFLLGGLMVARVHEPRAHGGTPDVVAGEASS